MKVHSGIDTALDDPNSPIAETERPPGQSRRVGLSIVIPVYNGEESIGILVDALAGLSFPDGHEIVLVVDGSPDRSLAVCRKLAKEMPIPVTVVDLARNFGEHNAVMAGFVHARGQYIITMDDDLQNPPQEVARLYQYTREGGWDVVYTFYDVKAHARWRNIGSYLANLTADLLMSKPKGLYLSSFRCLKAGVAREALRYSGPFPYVDGLIMQVTQNVGRLKVEHLPRASGRSNYTMRKLLRLWFSIAMNFSVVPLRIASLLGICLSIVGTIAFLFVIYEAIQRGDTPRGWPSVMGALLLLSGVQMLMLGIIGEYLGRLFLTTNNKPQWVARSVYRPADEREKSKSQGRPAADRPSAAGAQNEAHAGLKS